MTLEKSDGLAAPVRVADGQALLDQRDELLLAHALAPARQRRAVERQLVTEELLAAEQLISTGSRPSARTAPRPRDRACA